MKLITRKESVARGCQYCTHSRNIPSVFVHNVKDVVFFCNNFDCPYEELDGHKTYEDYMKENGMYYDMRRFNLVECKGLEE